MYMGNSMSNQQFFGMNPLEWDKILHRHTTCGLIQRCVEFWPYLLNGFVIMA